MNLLTTIPQSITLTITPLGHPHQGKEQHPPLHFGIVAIEKGALGSPTTMVANFTLLTWFQVIIILIIELCLQANINTKNLQLYGI